MCPENITIPGACRELMPFFFNEIYFPMEAGWIRPTKAGVHPPKFTKKHGHKCNGMCVCVCVYHFLFDPPIPSSCMFGPQGDDISQMMIFFLTPTLPFLNGAKFHTNAISSPSTLVVPNDEVLRLDWSKGPAGAPWGTPSTWQKEMVSLEGAG